MNKNWRSKCVTCHCELNLKWETKCDRYCKECGLIRKRMRSKQYYKKHYKKHKKPFEKTKLYHDLCNDGVQLHRYQEYGLKSKKSLWTILSYRKKKGIKFQRTEITIYKIKPKSDTNEKSEMANTNTAT